MSDMFSLRTTKVILSVVAQQQLYRCINGITHIAKFARCTRYGADLQSEPVYTSKEVDSHSYKGIACSLNRLIMQCKWIPCATYGHDSDSLHPKSVNNTGPTNNNTHSVGPSKTWAVSNRTLENYQYAALTMECSRQIGIMRC